jgi:hypothetical protein
MEDTPMKVTSILMVLLALVVGIAPLFLDCQSQGKSLTTSDGKSIPMKCHWTAIAEIGMAVPIGAIGILTFLGKRKEPRRSLGLMGIILGAFVILIPTALIGVCANPTMLCNMIMRPLLILSGTVIAAASLYNVVAAQRMPPVAL